MKNPINNNLDKIRKSWEKYKHLYKTKSDTLITFYKTHLLSFLKHNKYIFWMFASFYFIDISLRLTTNVIGFYSSREMLPNALSFYWIVFLISIILMFPRHISKIIYNITVILFAILGLSQYIYFKIFNKFFWLDDITVAKEGLDYTQYILSSLDYKFLMMLISVIIILYLANRTYPVMKKGRSDIIKGVILSSMCVTFSLIRISMLPAALGEKEGQQWDSFKNLRYIYENFYDQNKVMQLGGFYDYVFRDFQISYLQKDGNTKNETYAYLDDYFDNKKDNVSNDYTGIFAGKNLIMVMIETGDNWLISEEYTPTIKYMMENGINFENYYAPIWGAGATFNSEFTSLTGMYSLTKGNAAYAFTKNTFTYSMPNVFKSMGYSARSYHFNNSSYYNRGNIHNAIGFDEHYSFIDMGGEEKETQFDTYLIDNPQVNETLYQDEPFFDFFITYSAHLPYNENDNICKTNAVNFPELWEDESSVFSKCAKVKINVTDQFFQKLLIQLNDLEMLDDTVIVAYADHYAYGYEDHEELQKFKAELGDTFLLERVPFFIYNHGIAANSIDKVVNTSDVLPTILNLFGHVPDKYYSGYDAFDPNYTGYVYFSDFSWYNGDYYFQSHNNDNTAFINDMNSKILKIKDVNDKMLTSDYFKHIGKIGN